MKAREKGGVVDERLKVYGVEGLMVAGAFFFHPSTIRTSIFVSCISFQTCLFVRPMYQR